jgi:hypothetical protein
MSIGRKYVVKKSLGGSQAYRVWEDYSVGDWVLGRYVGNHVCQYKKQNPKIEVIDALFDDSDLSDSIIGKTLVLNAVGSLSAQIEKVEEGETVRVTYNGKNLLTKGPYAGKEAHSVTVDIIEVEDNHGL